MLTYSANSLIPSFPLSLSLSSSHHFPSFLPIGLLRVHSLLFAIHIILYSFQGVHSQPLCFCLTIVILHALNHSLSLSHPVCMSYLRCFIVMSVLCAYVRSSSSSSFDKSLNTIKCVWLSFFRVFNVYACVLWKKENESTKKKMYNSKWRWRKKRLPSCLGNGHLTILKANENSNFNLLTHYLILQNCIFIACASMETNKKNYSR